MTSAMTKSSGGFAALVLAGMLVGYEGSALAMEAKVVGNQLILGGAVVDGDLAKIKDALDGAKTVDAIVLRNSPGGHVETGYRTGELFRERGLTTAVSGYCHSSCSRMFLGGRTRVFTDDYPPEYTHVGFHGHYDSSGHLMSKLVDAMGLADWTIKHSDGKADRALVQRWVNIPLSTGLIHFFHPDLVKRDGASTFMCQGSEPRAQSVFGCERVPGTALDLGVITSLAILKSNDQTEVRSVLPKWPPRSGFAAVDDIAAVPLRSERGRQEYQRFLAADRPRAMALSPDGTSWAWNAGRFDASVQALERCRQRSNQTCVLYAIDDDVVWTPH
jgi:hypothetical protein